MDLTRRRFLEAMTATGASVSLAGCGGDTGGRSARTSTPTDAGSGTTPTPTSGGGTSAQEAYPGYEWSKLQGVEPTRTTTVTLRNVAFHPLIAKVTPGTTVTFVNEDATSHTVTIPKLGVDKTLSGGESVTVTFEQTGTYGYVCTFHGPSMLGRIVVSESMGMDAASPTPTATSTPTPTQTQTATPTPTSGGVTAAREAYPDYDWATLQGVEPTVTTEVTLRNFAFHPLVAKVSPGTTVTFTNRDGTGHTVTIPQLGVDRTLSGGASTTVTFEQTGTYGYVCTFHPPSMLGKVVVGETTGTGGDESGDGTPTPTPTEGGGFY